MYVFKDIFAEPDKLHPFNRVLRLVQGSPGCPPVSADHISEFAICSIYCAQVARLVQ